MLEFVREAFFGPTTLLSEIPACGRSDQRAARRGLPAHEHPEAFEVCLIARGEVDWWVADRVFTVRSEQVFFTRPGERHGGVWSMIHPCELYWFQLTRRPPDDYVGWTAAEAATIRDDITSLPVRHFAASGELQRAIRAVVDEHRRPGSHSRLAARAALHTALILLIREAGAAPVPVLSRPVRQALALMARWIEEPFTVSEVAAAVGLSTVRLQARFRRELQCSMGAYRTRLRIHHAKVLLRDTDQQVTGIALRLGFGSSQYFATVFRQHVGVPPNTYRNQFGS